MKIISLISVDKENASLGRVSFWILLSISSYFWFKEIKFPETLYYFFSYVTLYNFGKKGLNIVTEIIPILSKANPIEGK